MKSKKWLLAITVLFIGIGSTIVYGKLFKDDEVRNIFDEIYFSGAPSSLNYHLSKSNASMSHTGCIKYREEEHIADFSGSIQEELNKDCLSQDLESLTVSYYKDKALVVFRMIFPAVDSESLGQVFFMRYYGSEKKINIDYVHNYIDKSKKMSTATTKIIPEEYYQKYNTSRDKMIERTDALLFQYFLPLYFDKNKENGNASRFSMEDLGEYTVEYHF